ncbi:MAG: glycogen synthase GlgA [Pseudomonadales bacterium]|nr:glycogen synthase GlgA [Pseudomonadales bacterium]
MSRLLFVASEAFPLIKTGGLADIAGTLPEVLRQQGMDVRLLLPAYRHILDTIDSPATVAELDIAGTPLRLLATQLPGTQVETWLLDHPWFSQRPGNPYHDAGGQSWPDNADRFMLLSRLAAAISTGDAGLAWRPDVLHCNDWHTGPAVALTHLSEQRPLTVFTIHSLAHMGLFDRATFERLHLPGHFWHDSALEFYNQFSFIKGGLVYADYVTTVSPNYAHEICEAPGGMGLEGLLQSRRERLVGILNGIDHRVWDPASDPCLEHHYDAARLADKALNKAALQRSLGLAVADDRPLLGIVGRLVEQKGLELVLPMLGEMLAQPAQLVVLGTGERRYEEYLQRVAGAHPDAMAVILAYDETMAHRIEAAADIFLMPSLFEPCGLNQLYSLRYGTLPVVRAVGGLADTVVDATPQALAEGTATGFVFGPPHSGAFMEALQRAIALWRDRDSWRRVQATAMAQDFSWQRSAARYMELYSSAH